MINKRVLSLALLIGLFGNFVLAQKSTNLENSTRFVDLDLKEKKRTFFFYWGYNRTSYATSDISLVGPGYNFTLHDVKARDLPKDASFDYINPSKLTIPQFDIRLGFYLNDKYAIAIGWDHMKYQTVDGSKATISGNIEASASQKYQGVYNGEEIRMDHVHFIQMEHSDGFNMLNFNIERNDYLWIATDQKLALSLVSGLGAGLAMPWTHSRIFGVVNDDRIHLSGIGAHSYLAFQGTFYNRFFLRATLQGGFGNMWDIAITPQGDNTAHAEQTIWYLERSLVVGYQFRIFKK